jgi:outer membrane protein assembly factor BamA
MKDRAGDTVRTLQLAIIRQRRAIRVWYSAVASLLLAAAALAQSASDSAVVGGRTDQLELFPILSYDSDAGFGYGAKVFAWNYLGGDESIDITLFNSTKGERWYRLVFSIPDFERRQGTVYPLSFDIILDYDKWIASNYYGVGNAAREEDRTTYTKEPLEIGLMVGRGWTPTIASQVGLRTKAHRNTVDPDTASHTPGQLYTSRIDYWSLAGNLRYDTRNSYIDATRGLVVQCDLEYAPGLSINDVSFTKVSVALQVYEELFGRTSVAARGLFSEISGADLPLQVLLPVGGVSTLRGYPQDRFVDRVAAVVNGEFRFLIFWRFWGIVGIDAGRVWNAVHSLSFDDWKVAVVIGLRFKMDLFIVRMDFGVSKETTGFYLNFGQLF